MQSDLQRVATLYEQTRQKSTIMFTTKGVRDQLSETVSNIDTLKKEIPTETTDATNEDKKRAAKLNGIINKKGIMVEYLKVLSTQPIPEGEQHMVWIREPKVYALTSVGLQGIGYSKNDNKIALRNLFGQESVVGTTFKDLGLTEPVLLFARDFVSDKEVGGIFIADPSNPVGAVGAVGAVGTVPGENASLLLKPLPAPKVDPSQIPDPGTYWASLGEGVKTGPESEVFFTEGQCVTTLGGEWRSFADWMGGRYEAFYDEKGKELGFCFKDGHSISYDAGPGNRGVGGPPASEVSSQEQSILHNMKSASETSVAAAASFSNAEGFKNKRELTNALNSYIDARNKYTEAIDAYSAILADVGLLEEPKKTTYKDQINDLIKDLTGTRDSVIPLIDAINQSGNEVPPATTDQAALTLEAEGGTLETDADRNNQDAKGRYTSYINDPSASSLTVNYIEQNVAGIINEYNNAASKYQEAIRLYSNMTSTADTKQKIDDLQAKIDMINNEKIPFVKNSGKEVIDLINGAAATPPPAAPITNITDPTAAPITNITDPTAENSVKEGGKLEAEADSLQADVPNLYPDLIKQSDGKQQIDAKVAFITGKYNFAKGQYQSAINIYTQQSNSASSERQSAIKKRITELENMVANIDSKIIDVKGTGNEVISAAQASALQASQGAAAQTTTGASTGADTGTTIEVSPALRNKLDALGSVITNAENAEQRGGDAETGADTSKAQIDSEYSGYRLNPPNYMSIQSIITIIMTNESTLENKYTDASNNYASAKLEYTNLTNYDSVKDDPEILTYINTKITSLDTKINSIKNKVDAIKSNSSSIIQYLQGIQPGQQASQRTTAVVTGLDPTAESYVAQGDALKKQADADQRTAEASYIPYTTMTSEELATAKAQDKANLIALNLAPIATNYTDAAAKYQQAINIYKSLAPGTRQSEIETMYNDINTIKLPHARKTANDTMDLINPRISGGGRRSRKQRRK